MKLTASILALALSAFLSGCVTSGGAEYCDVARPIRPSISDTLTEETARQILAENEKLAAICGISPGGDK